MINIYICQNETKNPTVAEPAVWQSESTLERSLESWVAAQKQRKCLGTFLLLAIITVHSKYTSLIASDSII